MAGSVVRRLGASAGLVLILGAGVVAIGGALATVLALTVDDTPAAEQATEEAGDVEVVRCGRDLRAMTARIRVTNTSSSRSDYFIDVEFVRRYGTVVVEVVPVVVEDVAAGVARRVAVATTRAARNRHFDCRIGDVDRLSA